MNSFRFSSSLTHRGLKYNSSVQGQTPTTLPTTRVLYIVIIILYIYNIILYIMALCYRCNADTVRQTVWSATASGDRACPPLPTQLRAHTRVRPALTRKISSHIISYIIPCTCTFHHHHHHKPSKSYMDTDCHAYNTLMFRYRFISDKGAKKCCTLVHLPATFLCS